MREMRLESLPESLRRGDTYPGQLPIDGEGGDGQHTVLHGDLGMLDEVHLPQPDLRMRLAQLLDHITGQRLGLRTFRSARRGEQLDVNHVGPLPAR